LQGLLDLREQLLRFLDVRGRALAEWFEVAKRGECVFASVGESAVTG